MQVMRAAVACQLDAPQAVADRGGNQIHRLRLPRNFDQAGSCVGHHLENVKSSYLEHKNKDGLVFGARTADT